MSDHARIEAVAREMTSVIPATEPLTLLEDIARWLDETDSRLGAVGTEMQDALRRWNVELTDALAAAVVAADTDTEEKA